MSRRFARAGWPRANEILAAVAVTGSATPHAEGAYSELDASTAQNVCGLSVRSNTDIFINGSDTSMLLTLAVGAAASEQDIVANIAVGGATRQALTWVPVHIPAGSRLSAKLRAEQVSDVYDAWVMLMFGGQMPGWGGYAACDAIGADTANSRGTPISNTAGTWTQIIASTTNPLRAFSMSFGLVDATMTGATHVVDVGVGPGGSEQILGTWVVTTTSTEAVDRIVGPPFIEVPIPAGSRLAVKKDSTEDLSCVIHGWR